MNLAHQPTMVFLPGTERCPTVVATSNGEQIVLALGAAEPVRVANELRTLSVEHPELQRRVILALPAEWCFALTVRREQLPLHRRQEAVQALLSMHLPLASERWVVASHGVREHRLLVACDGAWLAQWRDAMREAGCQVARIVPGDVLLLQQWLGVHRVRDGVVCLAGTSAVQQFTVSRGRLRAWRLLEREAQAIGRAMKPRESADVAWHFVGFDDAFAETLRPHLHDGCVVHAEHEVTWRNVLPRRPWLDLLPALRAGENGSAGGGQWQRTMALVAMVTLFAMFIALMVRAERYDDGAAMYRLRQAATFERYFERPAPPVGIARRFQSEWRRVTESSPHDEKMEQRDAYVYAIALLEAAATKRVHLLRVEADMRSIALWGVAGQSREIERLHRDLASATFVDEWHVEDMGEHGADRAARKFHLRGSVAGDTP